MTTQATEPRGYQGAFESWDDVQPEVFAPVLEYGALAAGAIVKHIATKKIEKNDRRYQLHTFMTRGGNGQPFSIWGAAALNDRLRALKPGAVLYLAYGGKHPHADDASKTEHRFTVKTPSTPGKLADGMRALEANHRAMDAFIQAESVRQRDERAAVARGGNGGEHEPPADAGEFPPVDDSQRDS